MGCTNNKNHLLDLNLTLGFPFSSSSSSEEKETDEDVRVCSPKSALSTSLSGNRREREEGEMYIQICDEYDGDDSMVKKKLRLSRDQASLLEEAFMQQNTLNPKQKQALANQLKLKPRQVEVWFQNRRARTKLKQTEVDCAYLRRYCDDLTAENQRLRKAVQELRALKSFSTCSTTHVTPPTTLSMCPSCQRVSSPSPIAAGRRDVGGGVSGGASMRTKCEGSSLFLTG